MVRTSEIEQVVLLILLSKIVLPSYHLCVYSIHQQCITELCVLCRYSYVYHSVVQNKSYCDHADKSRVKFQRN